MTEPKRWYLVVDEDDGTIAAYSTHSDAVYVDSESATRRRSIIPVVEAAHYKLALAVVEAARVVIFEDQSERNIAAFSDALTAFDAGEKP